VFEKVVFPDFVLLHGENEGRRR